MRRVNTVSTNGSLFFFSARSSILFGAPDPIRKGLASAGGRARFSRAATASTRVMSVGVTKQIYTASPSVRPGHCSDCERWCVVKGSVTAIQLRAGNGRNAPASGHRTGRAACPLLAKNCHSSEGYKPAVRSPQPDIRPVPFRRYTTRTMALKICSHRSPPA